MTNKHLMAIARHYARTALDLHRGGEKALADLLFEVSKLLVARTHLSRA